jgi:hypothetical protein
MSTLKLASMIAVAVVTVAAAVARCWPLVSLCCGLNTALLLGGGEDEE